MVLRYADMNVAQREQSILGKNPGTPSRLDRKISGLLTAVCLLAKVGVESLRRSKILLSPAEITKNYSIPRREGASERRFCARRFHPHERWRTPARLRGRRHVRCAECGGPFRRQARACRTRKLPGVISYDRPVNLCRSSHRVDFGIAH
jgi:hypothetical protein